MSYEPSKEQKKKLEAYLKKQSKDFLERLVMVMYDELYTFEYVNFSEKNDEDEFSTEGIYYSNSGENLLEK